MSKRRFVMEGTNMSIGSHSIDGFLHRARKPLSEDCAACGKEIPAGAEYVRIYYPSPPVLHKDCYLRDHLTEEGDWVILAVSSRKVFNLPHREWVCRKFTKDASTSKTQQEQ